MTSTSYLHPEWTAERVEAFQPVLRAGMGASGRLGVIQAFEAMPNEVQDWARETTVQGRVHTVAASAFVLPVMSAEGCDAILAKADSWSWEENDREAPEFRIKEAVVGHLDAECDTLLKAVLAQGAGPWFCMTRGRLPSDWTSLQLAQYAADERAAGSPHLDVESSYTCVISLNPDEIEGGGTMIVDGLLGQCTLPALPRGYGLFFDGINTLHAGLPVTSGTRKLLVAWLHTRNNIW